MATRFEDLLNEPTKKPAKSRFEQLSAEMDLGVEESPQDLHTKLQTDPVFQVLTPQQKTAYVMERLHGPTAPRPPGGIPGERTFGESLGVAAEELGNLAKGFLESYGHPPTHRQQVEELRKQYEPRQQQAIAEGHPFKAAAYDVAQALPVVGPMAAEFGEMLPEDPYRAIVRAAMPFAVGAATKVAAPPIARGIGSAASGIKRVVGPAPVPTGIEPFIAETKRGFLADVARGTTAMPSGASMMGKAVEQRNPYVVKTAEDLIRAATERTREVPPEIGAHTAETAGPVIQEAIQARLKGTEPLPGGREALVEPEYPEGVSHPSSLVRPQQALPAAPGALAPRGPQALVGRYGEAAIPLESGKLQFGKVTGLKELEGKAHNALDNGATQRNISPVPTATMRAAEPLWNLSEAEQEFVRSQFSPETRNVLFKAGAPLQGEYGMLPPAMQEAVRTEATSIPWKAFKGARSEVGRLLGNAEKRNALGDANVGALRQIYGAMTEDMRTALGPHPGLSQVFEIANNLTEYKRTLQKPPIGRALAESTVKKTGALPPSQIIPKLAKAAPEEVAAMRETIGPNVEAQTALKSGIVSHVLEQAKGDYGKALNLLEDQRHALGQKTFNRIKDEFQHRHRENTMADVLSASKTGELVVGPKFAQEWAKSRQGMADAGMAPEHIKAIDRFAETVSKHGFSVQLARQAGMATRGVGSIAEKGAAMGAAASLLTGRPLWAGRMGSFVLIPQTILKVMLKQGGPDALRKFITSPTMENITAVQKAAGGPPPPSGVRIRPPWPPPSRPGPPVNVTPPLTPPLGPAGPAPAVPTSGSATGAGVTPPPAPSALPRTQSLATRGEVQPRGMELVSEGPLQQGPPGEQRTQIYGTETRAARPPLRETTRQAETVVPPVPTPPMVEAPVVRTPLPAAPPAAPIRPVQPTTVPGRKAPTYDPARSLESAIRHLGGINPEKIVKSGTEGEWAAIPDRKSFIRKGAKHGPDTIVAELQRLGYNINSENELLEAMQNPAQRKAGTEFSEPTELDQAKAHIDMLQSRLRELETAGEAPPGEESAMDFFERMGQEEKPTEVAPKSSMEKVADEIADLGRKQHKTAEDELVNQIVKAPETRVSKRDMLGLTKKKRKGKGGTPLLPEEQKKF